MIIDLDHLLPELHKVYHSAAGLRENNGNLEFALDTSYGLVWFNCFQLPERAEKYLKAMMKMGES